MGKIGEAVKRGMGGKMINEEAMQINSEKRAGG